MNSKRVEPDEYYGEVLPCVVEIIAALHRLSGTAAIPSPEVVADWRTRFLAVRNNAVGGNLEGTDARSDAIRNAFDQLEQLSRNVHEDVD